MRKLLVATASLIGMSMFSAADVSAMPINASVVKDAASAESAVTPARYYYVYRWYYYRPVYRWHWHHQRYWYWHRW
jgi:hypothetical protein